MKQIVCANCGAKYKLPDSFQADKAKCKACGSVIDVASQLGGDDSGKSKPAAAKAKPAAAKAKPATARAKPAAARSAKSDDKPAPRRAAAGGRSRRGADDAGDDSGAGKPRRRERTRGAGRTAKADAGGGNKGALYGGILVVVALIVVGVIWGMSDGEGDNTNKQDPANNEKVAKTNEADNAATEDSAKPDKDTGANVAEGAGEGGGEATEAAADPEAVKAAEAAAAKAAAEKSKASSGVPETAADVYDPKRELDETPMPTDISEEEIADMKAQVQHILDFSREQSAAQQKLEQAGYKGIPAIVEGLRGFNYLVSDDINTMFTLHKLLRRITHDKYPVPFEPVAVGEDVPLATAHKNARGVYQWRKFVDKYTATAADWNAFKEKAKIE